MNANADLPPRPQLRPLAAENLPRLVDVLQWVYVHRFVTSAQLARGFPLGSERTARRYLRQLLDHRLVGLLPVRDGFYSDYRVYLVSGRGLSLVKQWRADEGIVFQGIREDTRAAGKTSLMVEHEKGLTSIQVRLEELLARAGGSLIFTERRYRQPDRQLTFSHKGKVRTFHPDLGFLARQNNGRLYPMSFVEFDRSSKLLEKLQGQILNYLHWSRSPEGRRYLVDLYWTHGSQNPQPIFRLLVVIDRGVRPERAEAVRVAQLVEKIEGLSPEFQRMVWLIEGSELAKSDPKWVRMGGIRVPLF